MQWSEWRTQPIHMLAKAAASLGLGSQNATSAAFSQSKQITRPVCIQGVGTQSGRTDWGLCLTSSTLSFENFYYLCKYNRPEVFPPQLLSFYYILMCLYLYSLSSRRLYQEHIIHNLFIWFSRVCNLTFTDSLTFFIQQLCFSFKNKLALFQTNSSYKRNVFLNVPENAN